MRPGRKTGSRFERDLAEVDRRPQHLDGSGLGERIVQRGPDEIAMQTRRQSDAALTSVQDVEGRRVLAEHVLVDDVVPDQITCADVRLELPSTNGTLHCSLLSETT
jgi:hypothetical protein